MSFDDFKDYLESNNRYNPKKLKRGINKFKSVIKQNAQLQDNLFVATGKLKSPGLEMTLGGNAQTRRELLELFFNEFTFDNVSKNNLVSFLLEEGAFGNKDFQRVIIIRFDLKFKIKDATTIIRSFLKNRNDFRDKQHIDFLFSKCSLFADKYRDTFYFCKMVIEWFMGVNYEDNHLLLHVMKTAKTRGLRLQHLRNTDRKELAGHHLLNEILVERCDITEMTVQRQKKIRFLFSYFAGIGVYKSFYLILTTYLKHVFEDEMVHLLEHKDIYFNDDHTFDRKTLRRYNDMYGKHLYPYLVADFRFKDVVIEAEHKRVYNTKTLPLRNKITEKVKQLKKDGKPLGFITKKILDETPVQDMYFIKLSVDPNTIEHKRALCKKHIKSVFDTPDLATPLLLNKKDSDDEIEEDESDDEDLLNYTLSGRKRRVDERARLC